MKAAILHDGELTIDDVSEPSPGHEEAVVAIHASGVCHSDLHLARGDWSGVPRTGALGHEGIGVVTDVGSGATGSVSVGQRVILGLGGMGGHWCGACDFCLGGRPRLCAQARPIMGTFAQQIAVWAPSLVAIPDNLADTEAPLACGGLTAYGAVKKLVDRGITPGRRVGVIGAAGGLGHYAVQIARNFGYRVIGIDVGEERLSFVRSLGAEQVFDASTAASDVMAECDGVDASLVFSARIAGFDLGMQILRRGGLFVAVGIPASGEGMFQLSPWGMFLKDPTIIYSAIGTVQDMRELIDLASRGLVSTHVSRTGSLSEIPTILDELEAGTYLGRAVITDMST